MAAGSRFFAVARSGVWQFRPGTDEAVDPGAGERASSAANRARNAANIGWGFASFPSFPTDPSTGAHIVADIPFADVVRFFQNDSPAGEWTAAQLHDIDEWQQGSTVVSSIYRLLRDGELRTEAERSWPCGPPIADPPDTEGTEKVTIRPVTEPPCDEWFAIDLYLRDDVIVAVRLEQELP